MTATEDEDEVKGTNSPIGPLSWHSSAPSSIICHAPRPCHLAMCRIFGLLRYCRRTALDKDVELMVLRHEIRVLKRQLHGRVRHRTTDRVISRGAQSTSSKVALGLLPRHARDPAPLAPGALETQVEAMASPARSCT